MLLPLLQWENNLKLNKLKCCRTCGTSYQKLAAICFAYITSTSKIKLGVTQKCELTAGGHASISVAPSPIITNLWRRNKRNIT